MGRLSLILLIQERVAADLRLAVSGLLRAGATPLVSLGWLL